MKTDIFKKPSIIKNKEGKWEYTKLPKGIVPIYKDLFIDYLNAFDPLFERAKDTCEFEFILTLLRVGGCSGPGWDPFESSQQIFKSVSYLEKKIKDFYLSRHLNLLLYAHIVEASAPYEILANLICICEGERFCIDNFPDHQGKNNYLRPQTPSEKIRTLDLMASRINMGNSIYPLKDVFDRDLRNAVFHSDYSLYEGEVRIKKPLKSYSNHEITKIMNKGLAYFNALLTLFLGNIRSYDKPKIVPVHKDFGGHPEEKAITIIRKNYGLAGIKDNWTLEQLGKGYIPFRIGNFYSYETKLLDKDPLLATLPPNKIDRINTILKTLPKFLSKYIVKKLQSKV
ncbi:MAG: hypothetical protein PHY02_05330 [Phycisphaerae bacterium]|nr:hypothetical protein [Phycisphaerae bacterium]